MSGPDFTNVTPEVVTDAAVKLAARAEALLHRWTHRRAELDELHAAKPWSHDEPGKRFEQAYLGEAGGVSAEDTVRGTTVLLSQTREKAALAAEAAGATQSDDEGVAHRLRGGSSPASPHS